MSKKKFFGWLLIVGPSIDSVMKFLGISVVATGTAYGTGSLLGGLFGSLISIGIGLNILTSVREEEELNAQS